MENLLIKHSKVNQLTEGLELLALKRIIELIGSAVHLETTLNNILKVLQDTLRMERATLLLLDKKTQYLTIKASCGLTETQELKGVYRPDEGVCGQIFKSGSPFVVPDIHSEPLFLNRTGARSSINKKKISFLGVPVNMNGKPVGVLTVDRLFGIEISYEEDIRFLMVLSTLISQFLALHKAIEKKEEVLLEENRTLKAKLLNLHDGHYIIGHSKPMQDVFSVISKVAPSDVTVLLLGESGTGKELVARAVHDAGQRREKAFIKVNCAALPEALLESELFGHERGAFTGALTTRAGRFELADQGTIFLDEIGELPLSLQAKLLRVLQEKQFERIGGSKTFNVDVRIIAATNVNLERAVAKGQFRADLFYRLNVVPIILPPLRERREDIPLLLNHFLGLSNEQNFKKLSLTSDLLDALVAYSWPGNVREMQNLVERMVILAESDKLTMADLTSDILASISGRADEVQEISSKADLAHSPGSAKRLYDVERAEIEAALKRNGWIQARAARELGVTPRQIGYRIRKYNLPRSSPL